MRPILLRSAARDALGPNAEADPPDRERGEAAQRAGHAERDAVVGADHARQPMLLETALALHLGRRARGAREAGDGEDVAQVEIGEGEGITVRAGGEAELALEVRRPDIVGHVGRGQPRRVRPDGPLPPRAAPRHDAPGALEQRGDRARRGPRARGLLTPQHVAQLARAPGGVRVAEREDRGDEHGRHLMRGLVRGGRAVGQGGGAPGAVARELLVAGLLRDAPERPRPPGRPRRRATGCPRPHRPRRWPVRSGSVPPPPRRRRCRCRGSPAPRPRRGRRS